MNDSMPVRMMTRPPTPPMTPARIVGVLLLLFSLLGADEGEDVLPPPTPPPAAVVVDVLVGEPAEVGLALAVEDRVFVGEEDEEIVIGGALPPPSEGSEFCAVVVVAPLALVMPVLGDPGAVYATVKTPGFVPHENAR